MLAAGAHALLRGGGPRVVALLAAQEDVLELVHPRVGEEQGRVVLGHERRALHHAVAALLEVARGRRCGSRRPSSPCVSRALARVVSGHSSLRPGCRLRRLEALERVASSAATGRSAARGRGRGRSPAAGGRPTARGSRRAGSTRGVLAPVAARQAVEDARLGDLAQRAGEPRLRRLRAPRPRWRSPWRIRRRPRPWCARRLRAKRSAKPASSR